jgi:hypothetical protein
VDGGGATLGQPMYLGPTLFLWAIGLKHIPSASQFPILELKSIEKSDFWFHTPGPSTAHSEQHIEHMGHVLGV